MIGTGDLERHIRRMRHEYARRRAAMTRVLGDGAAGRLLGDEAGMHMVLRTDRDAEDIAGAAWERGGAGATLARYLAGPVTANGLVLGYGGASGGEITRACRILVNLANAGVPGQGRERGGWPKAACPASKTSPGPARGWRPTASPPVTGRPPCGPSAAR